MSHLIPRTLLAVLILFSAGQLLCGKDLQPNWPYEKLFDKADVVIIASPRESKLTDDKIDLSKQGIDGHISVCKVTFSVEHVVKGSAKDTIDVFIGSDIISNDTFLIDPPIVVDFAKIIKENEGKAKKRKFLLFIKKEIGAQRFTLVSSYYYQSYSIKEVVDYN